MDSSFTIRKTRHFVEFGIISFYQGLLHIRNFGFSFKEFSFSKQNIFKMAARGRGRGKLTFDVGKIGFQKGEALPAAIQQPPPLFPVSTSASFWVHFCNFFEVLIDHYLLVI